MDESSKEGLISGVLVLAAHPNWRDSRVNRRLLAAAREVPGVRVQDLYAEYPDYDIDVAAQQALAGAASLIVLLHPIQWYSGEFLPPRELQPLFLRRLPATL